LGFGKVGIPCRLVEHLQWGLLIVICVEVVEKRSRRVN
jgi:hypothetical protein